MKRKAIVVIISLAVLATLLPATDASTAIYGIYPSQGSTLNGNVMFVVNVSSDVDQIDMYFDGEYIGMMDLILSTSGVSMYGYPLNTSHFSDGAHIIRYDVKDTDTSEVTSKSYQYIFDNSAPDVRNITVHYPSGHEALSYDPVYITAEISDMSGVNETSISLNSTALGIDNERMYDDGQHNDGASGDGIYGTELLYPSNDTGRYYINLTLSDVLGNPARKWVELDIDRTLPSVISGRVVYPSGQTYLKKGDEFRVIAEVRDNTSSVGGMRSVWMDCASISDPGLVSLFDDGMHMDGRADDGIYGSDVLVVSADSDGQKPIIINGEDIAGNTAMLSISANLDATPPSLSSPQVIYPSGQSWAEDGQTVRFSVNASDSASSISRVLLDASSIGGPSSEEMTLSGQSYVSGEITVQSGLYTGALRVSITAFDAAGNSAETYINVVLNNTVPDNGEDNEEDDGNDGNTSNPAPERTPPSIDILSIRDGAHISGETTITMVVSNDSSIERCTAYLDGEPHAMQDLGDGRYSVTLDTNAISDGEHTLSFVVLDSAGLSDSREIGIYVDNSAPELSIISVPSLISGSAELMVYSSDTSGVSQVVVNLDGSGDISMADAGDGRYIHSLDSTGLSDGLHTATFTSTDVFGHSASMSVQFRVDNTAPEISFTGGEHIDRNGSVSFQVSGAESAWFSVDGSDWMPVNASSGSIVIHPGAMVSGEGVHYIGLKAVDKTGNTAQSTVSVYIDFPDETEDDTEESSGDAGAGAPSAMQGSDYALLLSLLVAILAIMALMYAIRSGKREAKVQESTSQSPASEEHQDIEEAHEDDTGSEGPSEEQDSKTL